MTDTTLHVDPLEAARRSPSDAMAQRLGASVWRLELVEVVDLTPSMRRLRFHAETPESLDYLVGNDLTLSIAYRDDAVVRRRYSIRSVDPSRRIVDLDFVLHGDGPAGRWAATVEPGARVEGVGPRGKVTLADGVDWHLFAGDDAFLPATASMVGAIAPGIGAHVILEVDREADHQEITSPGNFEGVRYVHRDGMAPGESKVLLDALESFELPAGRGFAYLGGEHRIVSAMLRVLRDKGLAADQVAPKSYWRLGRANADHGEPPRED